MAHHMTLNSLNYVLVPDGQGNHIREERIDPFGTVVPREGVQRTGNIIPWNQFNLPAATSGFGLNKVLARDIDNPEKLKRSKVSRLDTRFVPTTLGRLNAASTTASVTDTTFARITSSFEHGGKLYALWEALYDSTPDDSMIKITDYTGSSTTWTNQATVHSMGLVAADANYAPIGHSFQAVDTTVTGTTAILLTNGGLSGSTSATSTSHQIFHDTDMLTGWTISSTPPTTNMLVNHVTFGENIDFGRLEAVDGVGVYLFAWDEDNLVVDVFKSTNLGVAWTAVGGDITSCPNGVHGSAVYYDLNGDVAPVFTTDDGVYAFDTSTSGVVHKLVSLPTNANNGKVCQVWSNPYNNGRESLYISLATGEFIEYTYSSSGSTVKILNFNLFGALDADMSGYGTYAISSNDWLFFSYGGHAAGKKAWIGAYSGQGSFGDDRSAGFHFIFQNDTANRKIDWMALSAADDGNLRLHFQERLGATTHSTEFILNPLSHPDSGATINYAASGVQDRPRLDMGFPFDNAAFFQVGLEADDLGADTSGEYINLDYGVNAAAASTDIGNILSGTRRLQIASGAGVEGREIQIRENYARSGTTTASPKGYDMEITYKKKLNKTSAGNDESDSYRRWTMDIDIIQTANQENRNAQSVLGDLYEAEGNTIGQTFSYGLSGTRYVECKVMGLRHGLSMVSDETRAEASKVTTVTIQLDEVP